jgi:hypothetical protein
METDTLVRTMEENVLLSSELRDLMHREAMLRRAAKQLLEEAERIRVRTKQIRGQVSRLAGDQVQSG